jgi:hypothetical protein
VLRIEQAELFPSLHVFRLITFAQGLFMPWQAKLVNDPPLVEMTYTGSVTANELHEALVAAASLSKSGKTFFFLADCTDMLGGHSFMDLYNLISLFDTHGIGREVKEAIILPAAETTQEATKFYEVACQNRGYNVRSFRERTEALSWLSL